MRPAAALSVAAWIAVAAAVPSARGVASGNSRPAGVAALDLADRGQWGWSGAWLFPVGDALDFRQPAPDGAPAFRVLRGVGDPGEDASTHRGADLSNGRGGDVVRAAAHGVVVVSARSGWRGGFGRHVVIAHRLEDGSLAYSVYAHLAPGSVAVSAGQKVSAGEALARVGRSGRATTEHLHFEVRIAADPLERWERARTVDPVAYVSARLPAARDEQPGAARYLEWAECCGLISAQDRGEAALTRAGWWRMLARTVRHPIHRPPSDPDALRSALVEAGVVSEDSEDVADAGVPWVELAHDLERARSLGVRIARPPLDTTSHRRVCGTRFAEKHPTRDLDRLARREESAPRVADACVLLADLCGPWEMPQRPRRKRAA